MKPTDKQLKACSQRELGFIATYFNKKISIKITKYLARTNVTPNEITVMSFLVGAVSAVLFSMGEYIYLIIGAILVQASYTLDCVDGEMARLKNLQTKFGAYLDSVLDLTRNVLIIFGVALGIFTHSQNLLAQLTVFSAILGVMMMDYVGIKKTNVFGQQLDLIGDRRRNNLGGAVKLLRYEEDAYLFLITLGALFNQVLIALIIVAITTNIYWFIQLPLAHRRSNED